MTEAIQTEPHVSEHSRSALARLTLLLEVTDGTEKVSYERRWPESAAARAWCEAKVREAPVGATVLEIQVLEEVWGRRHPWDATASRHIPETLQLGVKTRTGEITWGARHDIASDRPRRTRG
jgi:hypothetical protein